MLHIAGRVSGEHAGLAVEGRTFEGGIVGKAVEAEVGLHKLSLMEGVTLKGAY